MKIYQKLKNLLTPKERWQMFILLNMMFVGMVLETMGLGLVIPAVALMTQPDAGTSYPLFASVLKYFNHPTQTQLMIGGMLALFAIYFVKASFLIFMIWKQNTFVFSVQANISHRLFKGYLSQPWSFHLQRNSAQLILNVINESNVFATTTLQSSMVLLTEGLVAIGVSMLLVVIEPVGALMLLGMLGLILLIYYRGVRHHVNRWGELRQRYDGLRIQHLQQGLGGAKDVKILGRESNFINHYHEHNIGSSTINQKLRTLTDLPRLILELLAVSGLTGIVLVMLAQGKQVALIVPTIGLFAAAAFRLMPSANRILGAIQNLRYSFPIIHRLYEEITLIENNELPKKQCALALTKKIILKHVDYQYENVTRYALKDISLSITRGQCVGFIGKSGAGKSTLVDIILGLLTPQRGAIYIDDINIQSNLRGWQDQIGYVPQSIFLTDDTLKHNVAFGLSAELIDDEAVDKAIHAAQLQEFVETLPEGLNTFVGERGVRLSGGQRQRIGIARALYHNPQVLVLDEATSALDLDTEKEIMNTLEALHGNKTILIIAHRLSTVANCDFVYKMEQGRIVNQGSFNEVVHVKTTFVEQKNENEMIY